MSAAAEGTVGVAGASGSPRPILDVRNLSATIAGRDVLTAVSFGARRGEALGIVGETGSGKTLSCRAVMGLLPRLGGEVTGGEIVFDGANVTRYSERQWHRLRGRRLALVPQSSLSSLDPVMTIGRQLIETIRLLDPDVDPRGRALELLNQVEMPRAGEVLKTYAHRLSGGMRQRAMIALAITGRPEVLIADEPTTALDVTVQRSILELLGELRRSTGMSLIIVTHDLAVIEAVTDRVAIIYAGMTVESGVTADVLRHPAHPYTRALLAARPSARRLNQRLAAIAGVPPSPDDWPRGCRFAPRCAYAEPRCLAAVPEPQIARAGQQVACVRHLELADA
jgi:oligopeptide/dipeptide ABC transporter ATP-binding protein